MENNQFLLFMGVLLNFDEYHVSDQFEILFLVISWIDLVVQSPNSIERAINFN